MENMAGKQNFRAPDKTISWSMPLEAIQLALHELSLCQYSMKNACHALAFERIYIFSCQNVKMASIFGKRYGYVPFQTCRNICCRHYLQREVNYFLRDSGNRYSPHTYKTRLLCQSEVTSSNDYVTSNFAASCQDLFCYAAPVSV